MKIKISKMILGNFYKRNISMMKNKSSLTLSKMIIFQDASKITVKIFAMRLMNQ